MKILSTILVLLVFLYSCSTATIEKLTLSDGSDGYDVSCTVNGDCLKRAKVICKTGKFRVHNTFPTGLMELTDRLGTTMRVQCLDEQASLEYCSQPGVSCVL